MKNWQTIKNEDYTHYSDYNQIQKWIISDVKEAEFELKGYRVMKDPEMINYWSNIVDYFKNFLRDLSNINVEYLKRDSKFGDEPEQYASKIILSRLGIK